MWPGVVLRVNEDGVIVVSNGRLETLLSCTMVGEGLTDFLDEESSWSKWQRMLSDESVPARSWELVFCTRSTILNATAYTRIRTHEGARGCWLVEHPTPALLARMAVEVESMNTELATAQRSLVIERSRLNAALAEAERSNRALEEFAQAVSHDLKAPLRAILEYANRPLHRQPEPDSDAASAPLQRINELASRMRLMIDGALDYARAGPTRSHVGRAESVDTGTLLREVVDYLAPPPDMTVTVDENMPILQLERVPFERVVGNLLSNAIAFRRAGAAHVRVSAERVAGEWEFMVADNGQGISENLQTRIWNLFYTSRPATGTGVGLALVRRIVETRGGRVTVESTPGEGAQFRVRWPEHAAKISGKGAGTGGLR